MRTSSSSTLRPSAVVVRILLLLSVVSSFTTVQRTVGRSTTRTGATNRNSNSNRNSNNNRHSTTNTRVRLLSSSSSLFSRRTVLSTVGTALLIVPVVELVTRVRANCIDLETLDYPPPLESESWSSSSTWEGSTTTEEDTAGGATTTTTTTITLVFHGSGGTDTNTEALMSKLGGPTNAFMIHWYDYSKSTVFAAWNGHHIGTEVAKRLMASSSSSSISSNTTKNSNKTKKKKKARQKYIFHIIGISVGAMACDACVVELQHQIQQLQQQQKKKYDAEDDEEEEDGNTTTPAVEYYVQETLLDPLCARGIWDLTYGIRHFGRAADYAQQFYNTDDPVPFTNTPMTWAAVVDVTPVRPPAVFGHDWPLVYYTQYRLPPTMTSRSSRTTTTEGGRGGGRRDTPIIPPHEKGQRGEIVTVTTL